MQLRALIKTRRRKWAMIVLGVVVCAVAVWMLLGVGHKPTDEEKYRRMMRSYDWCMRLNGFRIRHRFPKLLDAPLRSIQSRLSNQSYDRLVELRAVGYVTDFMVTNGSPNISNLMNQVETTCPLSFGVKGNIVFVTCRSNDAARIRELIEKKP